MSARPLFVFFLLVGILFSCSEKVLSPPSSEIGPPNTVREAEDRPLNVILLIGDGMGLTQISTRYYFPDGEIHFERFKHIGLINTTSASHKITDSAAGATAFASGVRTYNGAIGVNTDTVPVPTLLEELNTEGYKTGLISTSSITHATPACFYAHATHRNEYENIASQLVESNVDFFAGAGREYFNMRTDKQDLMAKLKAKGFELYTDDHLPMLKQINGDRRYGFLNAEQSMPKMIEGRGNYLLTATNMALDYLRQAKQGFFLMVEGSQIDWGGHANDSEYIITETADFDRVIGLALDFAERDGNTLVVVTADHETGGYALSGRDTDAGWTDYDDIDPKFTSGGHSATLIPVFAYGPGSDKFNGMYENSGIYHRIHAAIQMHSTDRK